MSSTAAFLDWPDNTKEQRGLHWQAWRLAPVHQRNSIGVPPCWTCGAEHIGFYDYQRTEPKYPCHETQHQETSV